MSLLRIGAALAACVYVGWTGMGLMILLCAPSLWQGVMAALMMVPLNLGALAVGIFAYRELAKDIGKGHP